MTVVPRVFVQTPYPGGKPALTFALRAAQPTQIIISPYQRMPSDVSQIASYMTTSGVIDAINVAESLRIPWGVGVYPGVAIPLVTQTNKPDFAVDPWAESIYGIGGMRFGSYRNDVLTLQKRFWTWIRDNIRMPYLFYIGNEGSISVWGRYGWRRELARRWGWFYLQAYRDANEIGSGVPVVASPYFHDKPGDMTPNAFKDVGYIFRAETSNIHSWLRSYDGTDAQPIDFVLQDGVGAGAKRKVSPNDAILWARNLGAHGIPIALNAEGFKTLDQQTFSVVSLTQYKARLKEYYEADIAVGTSWSLYWIAKMLS